MKNVIKNFNLCVLFLTLLSSLSYSQQNLCVRVDVSNATLTSSQYDIGSISNCFDGNIESIMRTANVNPGFIQIVFESQVSIDSIGVYIGQNNMNIDQDLWWVETADNVTDLASKSGTYYLAVDSGARCGNGWDTRRLYSSVSKKIWKFNIKRVVGNDYIHIWELALYSFSAPTQSGYKYSILSEMNANNIVMNNNGGKVADEVFDGNVSSGLSFSGKTEARILLSLKKQFSINKIRAYFNSSCSWYLEYADSFSDLNNQSGTYVKTPTKSYNPNQWDSVIFTLPLNTKHFQLKTINSGSGFEVNEIEFYSDNQIDNLIGLQNDLELWVGWQWKNAQQSLIYNSTMKVSKQDCQWKSSDETVATVDNNGNIKALKGGNAIITASYLGADCSTKVKVVAPVKQIQKEVLNSFMSKPASNCINEVPVLIIQYIPTTDGTNVNGAYSPNYLDINSRSIASEKDKFLTNVQRMKFAFEEGSRYRKFKNPDVRPTIGLKVVDYITIYEPIPPSIVNPYYDEGILKYTMDFERLADQINLKDYVENKGVKYVILMGNGSNAFLPNYNPDVLRPENFRGMFESYMSTPTGHWSANGVNPEPLPLYNKTYVVINNYMGMPDFNSNNFEPFTHQCEAMLCDINRIQDGNRNLFWDKFVGEIGRCGWTHTPPNTKINYGYMHYIQIDPKQVQPTLADNEDWKPDNSGEKKLISYHSWEDKQYNWPDGITEFNGRYEMQWFIYWLQCFPGPDNGIPYKYNGIDYEISNWWKFIYDWDYYTSHETGLYELPKPKSILISTLPTEICSGQSLQISYTKQGTFNPNNYFTAQLSNANGDFSNPINIGTVNSDNSGKIFAKIPENLKTGTNYRIRIISDSPQFTGDDNGIALSIYQLPKPTITGDELFCQNEIQTFERNSEDFAIHKWAAINGTIIGCDTCDKVQVRWEKTGIGLLKLVSQNSLLCQDSIYKSITISAHSSPEISGANQICIKHTSEYQAKTSNSEDIAKFTWEVLNGEIESSNTNSNIKIFWNNAGKGTIKLFTINKAGCLDSAISTITINDLPKPQINGLNRACVNDVLEYSVENNESISNQWIVSGGNLQSENDGTKIKVLWDKSGTGTIKLIQKILSTGCEDSVQYSVEIIDNPEKPTITKDNNKLISSALTGNQWYLNNQILKNEINQIIYPPISGLYQVQITLNGCKSEISEKFDYIIDGVEDFGLLNNILIYPNPIDNILKIDLLNFNFNNARISVIDVLGTVIFVKNINEDNKQIAINFENYPAGVYFINLCYGQNSCTRKMLKR